MSDYISDEEWAKITRPPTPYEKEQRKVYQKANAERLAIAHGIQKIDPLAKDSNPFFNELTIKTKFDAESNMIIQEEPGAMGQIIQRHMNLREKGIRDALIEAGWTPPGSTFVESLTTISNHHGISIGGHGCHTVLLKQEENSGEYVYEDEDEIIWRI